MGWHTANRLSRDGGTMRPAELLSIHGVFPAVKCAICSTVYDAGNDDFVAFHGPITTGLEAAVVPWSAPPKPYRRAVSVVCRTPECMAHMVRGMLRCAPDGEAGGEQARELWLQALRIWAAAEGHEVSQPGVKPAPPPSKARRTKR